MLIIDISDKYDCIRAQVWTIEKNQLFLSVDILSSNCFYSQRHGLNACMIQYGIKNN